MAPLIGSGPFLVHVAQNGGLHRLWAPSWLALGASWAGLGRSWAVLGPLMPQGPVPQDFFALPTSVVLLEPTANSAACECECAILLTLANSQILSTTRYSQTLTGAS